jgi:hypothetical protein
MDNHKSSTYASDTKLMRVPISLMVQSVEQVLADERIHNNNNCNKITTLSRVYLL